MTDPTPPHRRSPMEHERDACPLGKDCDLTPEAQSKAARQRNELRAQAETIARLQREKMELLRDLRAAKAHNARADLVLRWSSDMEAAKKHNGRALIAWPSGRCSYVSSDLAGHLQRLKKISWRDPTYWMPLLDPPKGKE